MLKGRDLLSIADLTKQEFNEILQTAIYLKSAKKSNIETLPLKGKTLAMIFEKPSTRTRVSFEVGMYQLGGQALYLSSRDLQLGRGETIADTARVLNGYVDGIMARVFSHSTLVELAKYADIPVINGLSDLEHPCQIIGDFLTIKEQKGSLKGIKLAYTGDSNNVLNSLLLAAALMQVDIFVASPANYQVNKEIMNLANAIKKNSKIVITEDPKEAVKDADVVYTDVWVSMGQEKEAEQKEKVFQKYQLNKELLSYADSESIVLHCLPAHRGKEITDEVMDGPHSKVFQQAENRLHAQKAIMTLLMQ